MPKTAKRIPAPRWPADPLSAMAQFEQGQDPAHLAMRRLVRRVAKAGLDYAVLGGLAVYKHGYRRMTDDVDLLLTRQGLEEFRRLFVPKFYEPVAGRPRRFIDKKNGVTIDILVTGLYPGRGEPGPIAFPNPADVREPIKKVFYIDLATLIQLKLAARRYQDFADVVNLIAVHNLDESYLEKLHPSLHRDFVECLEEKRREDEYQARED